MPQERPHSEFNINAELARQEEARNAVFEKIKQDDGSLGEKKLDEIFFTSLLPEVIEIFGKNCLVETDLQGNIKKIHVFAGMSEAYLRQAGAVSMRFKNLAAALTFLLKKISTTFGSGLKDEDLKKTIVMHAAYPIEGILGETTEITVREFVGIISRDVSDLIQVVGEIPIVTTKLWAVPNGINEGGDLFQNIKKSVVQIILRLLRIQIRIEA